MKIWTPDEIRRLRPGKKTDRAVRCHAAPYEIAEDDRLLWSPSTSIEYAWELLDDMLAEYGGCFSTSGVRPELPDGGWRCYFGDCEELGLVGIDESPMMAICRGALLNQFYYEWLRWELGDYPNATAEQEKQFNLLTELRKPLRRAQERKQASQLTHEERMHFDMLIEKAESA